MKACGKCKRYQTLDLYSKDITKLDGLHTTCKTCQALTHKAWRSKNLEKIRAGQRQWEKENRAHCNAKYRAYSAANRERRREITSASVKRKPWLNAAREAKRRAAKLSATPQWADIEAIKDIYEGCPQGFHVDHMVPLQGKNVCGLHVENNLQYLLASDNVSKSNIF